MDINTFDQLEQLYTLQRHAYRRDPMPSHATRMDRLDRLLKMTEANSDAIVNALQHDFGHRSAHEIRLAEITMSITAIINAKRHLRRWMKTKRVSTPLSYWPSSNRLVRQPLGVVGIVAPWNYPYQLSIGPAICAIAAGNRVMIKPSEHTPHFSHLLQSMIAQHFSAEEMTVVTGDAQTAEQFVQLPFDHLLFTGSTAVGRRVATLAAQNLTPVTLELGGKSPAIFDPSADLDLIAPRLMFAKLFNGGQTCIAPDYLLVPKGSTDRIIAALSLATKTLYPTTLGNPDYTGIINDRHAQRLRGLLDDALSKGAMLTRLTGEDWPLDGRQIPPMVVTDTQDQMQIMQEEIFGPILPIVEYAHLDEAIDYVNQRPRPLALYWFGQNPTHQQRILQETVSGGVTINDGVWHFAQETQPFGGVGASGQGSYHGEWGFRTFSQEKPVFLQSRFSTIRLIYPPYGALFMRMLALLKRIA